MSENHDVTEVYERRHEAALARISSALSATPSTDRTAELEGQLAEISREKAALEAELTGLRDLRNKDMAELDDLISQLKPLIGEA